MICKRLFGHVSGSSGEMEDAFCKYGIGRGKKMQPDSNKLRLALNNLKIKTTDKDAHLKTIMKGFVKGSERRKKRWRSRKLKFIIAASRSVLIKPSSMTDSSLEILGQWELFRYFLSRHEGDNNYNRIIRQNGFEIRNMYFSEDQISFGIVTTHKILIPYNVLAGGYQACMRHITDKISEIRSSILAGSHK